MKKKNSGHIKNKFNNPDCTYFYSMKFNYLAKI